MTLITFLITVNAVLGAFNLYLSIQKWNAMWQVNVFACVLNVTAIGLCLSMVG